MKLLPFNPLKNRESMDKKNSNKPERNEQPKKKSVILPAYLWDSLLEEAKKQRRTMTKQIEVILVEYYGYEAKLDFDKSPGSFGFVSNPMKKMIK